MLEVGTKRRARKRWGLLKIDPAENLLSGFFGWCQMWMTWLARQVLVLGKIVEIYSWQWEWRLKVGWRLSVEAYMGETASVNEQEAFFKEACLWVGFWFLGKLLPESLSLSSCSCHRFLPPCPTFQKNWWLTLELMSAPQLPSLSRKGENLPNEQSCLQI